MSTSPATDRQQHLAEALARLSLGDRSALATVYRATSAHLFGVILRIQPDRGVAEDLLQDVYISIWRAAGSYDASRGQPMTWLTSMARNRAIDSLRRRKAGPQTVAPAAVGDDDEDPLDGVASGEAGPLQLLQQAADARRIAHCLGELTSEQRQCVALAFYQGHSHAEVAAHLAQPLGTVKSWLRRALIALKACLGRAAADDRA